MRLVFALIFGLGGAGILIWLCIWQIGRLGEKEAQIADLNARLAAPAAALDLGAPVPARYSAVTAQGRFAEARADILTASRFTGAAFRIVQRFEMEGGAVLVDRGVIREADKAAALDPGPMVISGHIDAPDETAWDTPAPDLERNIWFARDVAAMAEVLGTQPILIVASAPTGSPSPAPRAVTARLPNNHFQYAVTWGLMAVVWLAMTGLYTVRLIDNRTEEHRT